MEKRLNIYIIIVTYNGMKWIEKCLASLLHSTYPIKVIVVDNDSTDGTGELILSSFPEVIWLPQKKNLGFGQGNNAGIRYALAHQADYVLLLNQDAYLQPTAVEEMLKVADGENIITPIHLNGDGSRLDSNFRWTLQNTGNQLLDDLLLCEEPHAAYDVGEVCAACWLIPIEMLRRIGGFNPLFTQYGEDNNYYTRIIYHKRKIVLSAHSRVWHDRVLHGNERLYNKKAFHLQTLVISCDPSLNICQCLYRWMKLWVHAPWLALKEIGWLILHVIPIMRSRREEKKEQACWL